MKTLWEYTHTHTHTHTGDLNKGITLVALIVTIIILLIFAGVSIMALTESGLFEKARQAEQKSENAQAEEDIILEDYENKISKYVDSSRDTVTLTTEEYNKLKNANVYSEDEIEIGTWADGKKIYRKVYLGINSTATAGSITYNEDIDTLINLSAYCMSGNTYKLVLQSTASSGRYIGINISKKEVYWSIESGMTIKDITIEYTKNN